MPVDLNKLAAPFPPDKVHWRVGPVTKDKARGQALCYIDARDVMDRLDEAVGPENWQCEVAETAKGRLVCRIGIQAGQWVWKSDGAGDTDIEGEKGGISDAFKRAAVHWGIGRYLYRVSAPWVALDPSGKKILPTEHAKLQRALPGSVVANGSAQSSPPPSAQPHEPAESRADPEATTAAGPDFGGDLDRAMQSEWTAGAVIERGAQIATALRDQSNKIADLDSLWSQYEDEIMTMPPGAQRGLRKVYDGQRQALQP